MLENELQRASQAAEAWAREQFGTESVKGYPFVDEEEPERYIVVVAVKGEPGWRALEVWLEEDAPATVLDLGEGAPPEEIDWPWGQLS